MFGLFDWVWELLYTISKSMYSIIDKLLQSANMLCGIQPITYQGQEMDFVGFLMKNPNIFYAFVGASMIAVVLVMIFGVFAIIRTISSEKVEKTPSQVVLQVGKTLLIFLFIPAAMSILMFFVGEIMKVLYQTTLGGSPDGLGRFLAGAFGQNALKNKDEWDFYLYEGFNYSSTSSMKNYVNLSDYDFFFSYISCIVIILSLGQLLLMFVDRAISMVILFIISPISMSTVVLDDGARFKLWRDQFITKFLMGYGCIVAINIYVLIIAAVTDSNLVFFNNSILNWFMKILIIVGGGVSMSRSMALIGNLIAPGAGSNELRDNAIATAGFSRAVGGAFGLAKGAFSATRGAINFARDVKNQGFGTALGRATGFRTSRDYNLERARLNAGGLGSGAGNNKTGNIDKGGAGNKVAQAINGAGKGAGEVGKGGANVAGKANNVVGSQAQSNANAAQVPNQGSNMVGNAVNNALSGDKDKEKKK